MLASKFKSESTPLPAGITDSPFSDSTIISSMDWITSQVTGSAFNKVIGNSQAVEISLGHQNETSTVYRNTMVDSDAINVMNAIMRGQKLWLPLLLVE